MPLTLTLTEGVLPSSKVPEAIRRLTDSMLKWHQLTGNSVMTPNITANVHIVPVGRSFSGGKEYGDGDVDFVVTKTNQDMQLFRNDATAQRNWIQFKLYGTSSNRGVIGALVRVTQGGITQMRRVTGGDSGHSQSDAILRFGVGSADTVDVCVECPVEPISYSQESPPTVWS